MRIRPSLVHDASAKYSQSSAFQFTAVRLPSRSTIASATAALEVPAAGYRIGVGDASGVTGAAIHQISTGATSTRSTSSRSLSRDHQRPRVRPISSPATNSAEPHEMVSPGSETSSESPAVEVTLTVLPET